MRAPKPRYIRNLGPIVISLATVLLVVATLIVYSLSDHAFWPIFWPDFVSGLLSTGFGLVLGLPAGLFINREIARQGEATRRADEMQLLFETLEILADALRTNRRALNAAINYINSGLECPLM